MINRYAEYQSQIARGPAPVFNPTSPSGPMPSSLDLPAGMISLGNGLYFHGSPGSQALRSALRQALAGIPEDSRKFTWFSRFRWTNNILGASPASPLAGRGGSAAGFVGRGGSALGFVGRGGAPLFSPITPIAGRGGASSSGGGGGASGSRGGASGGRGGSGGAGSSSNPTGYRTPDPYE